MLLVGKSKFVSAEPLTQAWKSGAPGTPPASAKMAMFRPLEIFWPPLKALMRMAPSVPEAVTATGAASSAQPDE